MKDRKRGAAELGVAPIIYLSVAQGAIGLHEDDEPEEIRVYKKKERF